MNKTLIKEAFTKIKEHITAIEGDHSLTKLDLLSVKQDLSTIQSSLKDLLIQLNHTFQKINQKEDSQTSILNQQVSILKNFTQQISHQFNILNQKIENIQIPAKNQNIEEIFKKLYQDQLENQLPKKIPEMPQLHDTIQSPHLHTKHAFFSEQITQRNNPTQNPTHQQENQTTQQIFPTDKQVNNGIPTDNSPFYRLISSYKNISIGNDGVPTDKPTDKQTNQQTTDYNTNTNFNKISNEKDQEKGRKLDVIKASEILFSLDSLKKEIRLKFKRLTNQEILIFSTIYQLEEEGNLIDYRLIAETLALSESSVRDYVQRIISKGIPIDKEKINNKKILLSISSDLKKIASLDTILQLRDL